ncbi:MAG TPA: hypothetical protein VF043_30925, partial [Ktedonobacteraceae bacterium]
FELLKNGVDVAPGSVRSSLVIVDEWLFSRLQGLRVRLFVCGQPVKLAPYLVYTSPNGAIPVREYEGMIAGYRFGVYCYDADTDIELIEPDGTAWYGSYRYQEEWGLTGGCPEDMY